MSKLWRLVKKISDRATIKNGEVVALFRQFKKGKRNDGKKSRRG